MTKKKSREEEMESPTLPPEETLEATPMQEGVAPEEQPQPQDAPKDGNYEVRLESAPTVRLHAGSPEEAWELYKKQTGVTASDHPPTISEVTD
jgi:hypothetical protein